MFECNKPKTTLNFYEILILTEMSLIEDYNCILTFVHNIEVSTQSALTNPEKLSRPLQYVCGGKMVCMNPCLKISDKILH